MRRPREGRGGAAHLEARDWVAGVVEVQVQLLAGDVAVEPAAVAVRVSLLGWRAEGSGYRLGARGGSHMTCSAEAAGNPVIWRMSSTAAGAQSAKIASRSGAGIAFVLLHARLRSSGLS